MLKMMKHIINKVFPFLLLVAMASCKNQDWSFPDYKYSTTYFPYQSPVRTLELGDDAEVDNSQDNKLQFSIGVDIAGMYGNSRDRKIGYVLDPTLANNLYTDKGDTLVALPQSYYTLSPAGTTVVSKGKMRGFIDVQLTDAFLNDPRAYKLRYVIPLRITSTETDSILKGKTIVVNPDCRIASNWTIAPPKDYTLFGIKYINPYHGKYLHRGKDVLKDASGLVVDQVIYRTLYVESNEIWYLQTIGRYQVVLTGLVRRTAGSPGSFKMVLTFDTSGNCTISQFAGSTYPVSGTGKFVTNGDEWGGKKRNSIILNYLITDAINGQFHQATDTLVVRDRDMRIETFNPIIK